MDGTSNSYRMFISDGLLDASIDAIRECSLQTRRYESIHTTIRYACGLILAQQRGVGDIHNFLSACQLEGSHRIHLNVDRRWKDEFLTASDMLNTAAGAELKPLQRFAVLVRYIRFDPKGGQ